MGTVFFSLSLSLSLSLSYLELVVDHHRDPKLFRLFIPADDYEEKE
jgi:hypothetical protein